MLLRFVALLLMSQIEKTKQAIENLDFSMIINKMVAHQGWDLDEAEEACRLYRNWLFLTAKYPGKALPPSEDIDEFWHNHILDTKKYRTDCQAVFGEFRDHYPYFGIDGTTTMVDLKDAFEETNRLHFEEFGDYIYEVRFQPIKRLRSFFERLGAVVTRGQREAA